MDSRKDLNYDNIGELPVEIEGAVITPDANVILNAYNEDAPRDAEAVILADGSTEAAKKDRKSFNHRARNGGRSSR